MITAQTRRESYFAIQEKTGPRQTQICEILQKYGPKTANEIMRLLGAADRNYVHPRLTELYDKGMVEVIGKMYDPYTKRSCAVYRRKER